VTRADTSGSVARVTGVSRADTSGSVDRVSCIKRYPPRDLTVMDRISKAILN
jgi:hypothetical protein